MIYKTLPRETWKVYFKLKDDEGESSEVIFEAIFAHEIISIGDFYNHRGIYYIALRKVWDYYNQEVTVFLEEVEDDEELI